MQHTIKLTVLKQTIHPPPFNAFKMLQPPSLSSSKTVPSLQIKPIHTGQFLPIPSPAPHPPENPGHDQPGFCLCRLTTLNSSCKWSPTIWTFLVSDFFHCPSVEFKLMTTVFVLFTAVFPMLRKTKTKNKKVGQNKCLLSE